MNLVRSAFAGLALAGACTILQAKPIAFAHGTTVMAEYGAGTMNEAQVFYAPKYFYSLGAGYLELESDIDGRRREITYARANYLVKRWNMENAQANVFVWGGAGQAYVSEINDHTFAWNAGGQIDYETRRIYSSLKTDLHRSDAFSHRVDTLQLGIAPYEHDYRHAGHLVRRAGPQLHGRHPRRHRMGPVAAAFQGRRLDRGRRHRPTANFRPWPWSISELRVFT